jgi:hypothetical protein
MMRDGDLEPHDWRACDRERQMPAGADDEEVHLRFVRLAKTCISSATFLSSAILHG